MQTPAGHSVEVRTPFPNKGEIYYQGRFVTLWSPRSKCKTLADALKDADKKLKEETDGNAE